MGDESEMEEDSMSDWQERYQGYQNDSLSSSMVRNIEQRIEQVKDDILKQVLRRGALLRSTGACRKRIRALKAEVTNLRASGRSGAATAPVDTQSRGADQSRVQAAAPSGAATIQSHKTAEEPSEAPNQPRTAAGRGGAAPRAGASSTNVMDPRRRQSAFWAADFGQDKRPISDFVSYSCIAFSDLANSSPQIAKLASDMAANNSDNSAWFQHALDMHLRTVASSIRCSVHDVCWFVQLPYSLPSGRFISASAAVNSFECSISASLCLSAVSIECMMLGTEMDFLERLDSQQPGSSSGFSAIPKDLTTPAFESRMSDSDITSHAHNQELVKSIQIRCGVAKLCPVSLACKHLARQMLRQHVSILPRTAWRAACMRGMQWLQGTIRKMRMGSPNAVDVLLQYMHAFKRDNPEQEIDAEETDDQVHSVYSAAEIPEATIVACELLLYEMHVILQDTAGQNEGEVSSMPFTFTASSGQHNMRNASPVQLRARMMELTGCMGITCRVAFLCSPRTICSTWAGVIIPSAKVQRMQLQGIARLALTPAQSTQHAADWQTWVRRRKALTRNLLECLKRMNSALPTASYLRHVIVAVRPEVLTTDTAATGQTNPSLRDDQRDDVTLRNISHPQQDDETMRGRKVLHESRQEHPRTLTSHSDLDEDDTGSQDASQRSRYIYVVRRTDSASERSTAPFSQETAEAAATAVASISRSEQTPGTTGGGIEPSSSVSKSSALGGQANTAFLGSPGPEFQKQQAQGAHQEQSKVQKRDREGGQSQAQQTQVQGASSFHASFDTQTQDIQTGLSQGGLVGFPPPLVQPQGIVAGGGVSASGVASGSVPVSVPGSAVLGSALQQQYPDPGTGNLQGTFAGTAVGAGAGTSAGTAVGPAAGPAAGATAGTSSGTTAETVAGTSAETTVGAATGTAVGIIARTAAGTSSAAHAAVAAPAFSARQPHVPSTTAAPPALNPTTAANVSRPALSSHPINTEDSDLVDLEISSSDQNLCKASRTSSSSSIPAADAPTRGNEGNAQRHSQAGDPNAAQSTGPMHETHAIQADTERRTPAAGTATQGTDDDDIGLPSLFNAACMQMEALCIERGPDDGTFLMATRLMHGDSDLEVTQKRFLGENGVSTSVVESAMHELRSLLKDDAMLISETCAPLWMHMTPVQMARVLGDKVKMGAPKFDVLKLKQAAAHDEHWKEMCAPLGIFE